MHQDHRVEQVGKQMLLVLLVLCIFWDSALVHNLNDDINWTGFMIGFVLLHGALIYCFYICRKSFRLQQAVSWVRQNFVLLILIAIFVIITFDGLRDILKWDELEYELAFSRVKVFNFSPSYLGELFSLCGHKTWGYTIIGSIGEFLFPINGLGIRLVQIGMGLVTILALYRVLAQLLPNSRCLARTLLVALLVCNPAFISNVTYISPDYAMACFFIWMIACHLSGKKVLLFACNLLLCFSKETGILLCFFYYAGYYFAESRREENQGHRFKTFLFHGSWKEALTVLFAPIVFLLCVVISGSLWVGSQEGYVSGFRFEPSYLLDKFKSLFLINFNWILLIVSIYLLVQYIRKKISLKIPSNMIGYVSAIIGFMLFGFSYVTYNHVRYNVIFYLLFGIVMIYLLWNVQRQICMVLCGGLSVLFLVETFYTIDPVTTSVFRNLDLGNGNIITTREDQYGGAEYDYSDSIVYNREYTYVDQTLLQFLEDIQYDGSQLLVFPNMTKAPDVQLTVYCLFGAFEPITYNKEGNGFWASYMDETTWPDIWPGENIQMNLLVVNEDDEDISIDDYEEVYYIDQTCGYTFDSDTLIDKFQMEYFNTYDYRTAKTVVYKIKG